MIKAKRLERMKSLIGEHVSLGCYDASGSLGIQEMPTGYALMLNPDRSHFFWLRHDGLESTIHWDKWAVYHSACADAGKEN